MATTRQPRLAPGSTKCPRCRHIVANADIVEIVQDGNKKGKRVCTSCGIEYLKTTGFKASPAKGPVQSKGQTQLF